MSTVDHFSACMSRSQSLSGQPHLVQHDGLTSSVLAVPWAAVETSEADNMVDVTLVVALFAALVVAFAAAFGAAFVGALAAAFAAALEAAAASDDSYLLKLASGFDADRPDKAFVAAVVDGIVAAAVVAAMVVEVEIGATVAVEVGIVVGLVTVVKAGIEVVAAEEVVTEPVEVVEAAIGQVVEGVHAAVDTIVHALEVVGSQVALGVERNVASGN